MSAAMISVLRNIMFSEKNWVFSKFHGQISTQQSNEACSLLEYDAGFLNNPSYAAWMHKHQMVSPEV